MSEDEASDREESLRLMSYNYLRHARERHPMTIFSSATIVSLVNAALESSSAPKDQPLGIRLEGTQNVEETTEVAPENSGAQSSEDVGSVGGGNVLYARQTRESPRGL